jgi:dTDP-4-dehydrorhamnose reductase
MSGGVFITGGSGLLALNWGLATRDHYKVTLGLHARKVALAGVSAQYIKLESADDLTETFDKLQPFLVVHAAGMTNVEACEADPTLANRVNVDLAVNVAKAGARLGFRLAHISTDHLFSAIEGKAVETQPVSPTNVYGQTKAIAESRVLDIYPEALVVRTNFYGWGPSYRRSFSDVILTALREGRRVTLFRDVFYTPILIETLVRAVHDLVERNARGIFHVVSDERITKHEFGLRIAKHFRLDPGLIDAGELADHSALIQRPREMGLSNEKASRVLGRKLGGIDEHLRELLQQERQGIAREMQSL